MPTRFLFKARFFGECYNSTNFPANQGKIMAGREIACPRHSGPCPAAPNCQGDGDKSPAKSRNLLSPPRGEEKKLLHLFKLRLL